jgi:hypothetical protein
MTASGQAPRSWAGAIEAVRTSLTRPGTEPRFRLKRHPARGSRQISAM